MARFAFVNPSEEGQPVTSIPVDSVDEGIRLGQRMVVRNWHAWVRDDDSNVVWEFDPMKQEEHR
jgi:hypothetical protein